MAKIIGLCALLILSLSSTALAEDNSKAGLLTSMEKSLAFVKDLNFRVNHNKSMTAVCLSLGATKAAHSQLVMEWNKYASENFSKALLDESVASNIVKNQKEISRLAKICLNDGSIEKQDLAQSVLDLRTRLDSFVDHLDSNYGIQRVKVTTALNE